VGVGAESSRRGGVDRVPGEAAGVHPGLPAATAGGAVDREHAGGEVQRLGDLRAVQAPGDELVAAGGSGPGDARGSAPQWGAGSLASGPGTPGARATGAAAEGRLSAGPAHQLASAYKNSLPVGSLCAVWGRS